MHRTLLAAATVFAVASGLAFAQGDDDMCPSGQINTAPAGSPQACEPDVTATTPAPDIVEDAAEVATDAGEAVIDAGKAVVDTITDAVNRRPHVAWRQEPEKGQHGRRSVPSVRPTERLQRYLREAIQMKFREPRAPSARTGATLTLKPARLSLWEKASSCADPQTANTPSGRNAV